MHPVQIQISASACHTEVTMGGRGCRPPVLPWCPVNGSARNAPAWKSASPPGHYTPRKGRASVLIFMVTSSKTSWDLLSRLPRHPSSPSPLLSHRAVFGNIQPVTPSLDPYRTPDIVLVTFASPGSFAPIPLSSVYKPRPPGTRSPGMVRIPYPQ